MQLTISSAWPRVKLCFNLVSFGCLVVIATGPRKRMVLFVACLAPSIVIYFTKYLKMVDASYSVSKFAALKNLLLAMLFPLKLPSQRMTFLSSIQFGSYLLDLGSCYEILSFQPNQSVECYLSELSFHLSNDLTTFASGLGMLKGQTNSTLKCQSCSQQSCQLLTVSMQWMVHYVILTIVAAKIELYFVLLTCYRRCTTSSAICAEV